MEVTAGTLAAKAAGPVAARLVSKLFTAPAGAGLVDNPVRIAGRLTFKGEKRTLAEKDIQRLVSTLVKRTVESMPREVSSAVTGEQDAVADRLTRTLLVLGEIDMDDVQAVQLGYEQFAAELRRAAPRAALSLSASGEAMYESLLELSCLHILQFFSQRSSFIQRTQLEQFRAIAAQARQIDLLLDRIPSRDRADVSFERDYAEAVRADHGKVRIFGLDLGRAHGRGWNLDTAYLTLEATSSRESDAGDPEILAGEHGPSSASRHDRRERIDQLLADKSRILLRGQAGAGKSTLIQWLAVGAATGSFAEELSALNHRVPFVLRLRKMSRQGILQPRPSQFLEVDDCLRADSQPDGWADRVLRAGRALLLVDGLDEIPPFERDEAKEWMARLLELYPRTLTLVTVRPSAVPVGWLDEWNFEELSLCSMNAEDRELFVERWHRAAQTVSETDGTALEAARERQELTRLRDALLRTLGTSPDLSALADSPLLCGMICALHREWDGTLPKRRMDVYRAALSMLLVRRDQQRRVGASEGMRLAEEEQLAMLQRIASWLVLNGRVEGEKSHAEGQMARLLPTLPEVERQCTPQDAFNHLLNRTGLLRETSVDTFDFIHRTFQDYLAAKEFKEERNFGLLSSKAGDDQWADVIRMAVGHCDPNDRSQLMKEILDRGDSVEEAEEKRRIHLLLGSCLPYASRLDGEVRKAVLSRVGKSLPPRAQEWLQYAMVGEQILPELRKFAAEHTDWGWLPSTAVQAAGSDSLPLLRDLMSVCSSRMRTRIAHQWHNFDTATFASEILSGRDLSSVQVDVGNVEQLAEIPSLGPVETLICNSSIPQRELSSHLLRSRVSWLVLGDNQVVSDISFLGDMPDLCSVTIFGCPRVGDLSPLAGIGLGSLYLDRLGAEVDCGTVMGIARGIDQLRNLGMQMPSLRGLTGMSPIPQVEQLLLYGVRSYEDVGLILQAFPAITRLFIQLKDPCDPLDLSPLAVRPELDLDIPSAGTAGIEVLGRENFPDARLSLDPPDAS
ncbi:NACHT domain-containing protein [Streptomyces sp. NPDC004134]|uniref:NACHT domain-containing protein n=1 Tax=Streptomyces sp. NPDC004134 TaxID=3364691 RepID=UPI00367D5C70